MTTKKSEFPRGWDQTRVQDLLDYYERPTDEEAAAEHEAALSRPGHSLMEVPTELVPALREIIAEHTVHPSGSGPRPAGELDRD